MIWTILFWEIEMMKQTKSVILENESIRLEVLPHLGGNIFSIFHKESATEILWNKGNPNRKGSFDESWFGGLDVMFPNDVACKSNGYHYPDHGVIWDKDMDYHQEGNTIELHTQCKITHCDIKIKIALDGEQVKINADVKNVGMTTIPYLFRFHPAFLLDDGDKITVQPKMCYVDEICNSPQALEREFYWPLLRMEDESIYDVSVVDSSVMNREIFHHYALIDTKLSIERAQKNIKIMCIFSSDLAYMTYYGALKTLHDCNICAIEPATSIPADLEVAIQNKTAKYLKPNQMKQFEMILNIVSVYHKH